MRAIRDLRGKTVTVPQLGSPHHVFLASMAAYVGLDPHKDINFVTHPGPESIRLLSEGKIDAYLGFPPEPQAMREQQHDAEHVLRHGGGAVVADVADGDAELHGAHK